MSAASSSPHAAADLLALAAQCRQQLTGPGGPFELAEWSSNGQTFAVYRHAFATLPAVLNAGRAHAAREFMVFENDRWTYERFY